MKRWLQGEDFYENLCKDEDVRKYLNEEEIKACFDYKPMSSMSMKSLPDSDFNQKAEGL